MFVNGLKMSGHHLKIRYFSSSYFIMFAATGVVLTLLFHALFPGHRVSYHGSYALHFWMDSLLNTVLIAGLFLLNSLIQRELDRHTGWDKSPLLRLLLQVGLISFCSTLLIILLVSGYAELIAQLFPVQYVVTQMSESNTFWKSAPILLPVVFMFYQIIYLGAYFFRQWRNSLIETERLQKENLQSQLLALRNQVNPHFLFNSLSSLTSLIAEDTQQAITFVQELSLVYRYVLRIPEGAVSRLEEELTVVKAFISLHQIRFGANLNVSMNISDQYKRWSLPPTALLILFENTVQHNIISSENPLHVSLYSDNDHIIIENNLQRKRSRESSGTGLHNINERYKLLGYAPLQVTENDSVFRVSLPLIPPAA